MSSSLLLPEKIPWLAGKIFNYTPLLQNLLKELNKRVIGIMLLLGFLLAEIYQPLEVISWLYYFAWRFIMQHMEIINILRYNFPCRFINIWSITPTLMSRGGLCEFCLLFQSMHLIPGWACCSLSIPIMCILIVSETVMKVGLIT